jgi:hypothetical protein
MANNATLIRLPEKSSRWLLLQAERIQKASGRYLGRGPLVEGVVNALAELKLDFSDCSSVPAVTVKAMSFLRPWAAGSVAPEVR